MSPDPKDRSSAISGQPLGGFRIRAEPSRATLDDGPDGRRKSEKIIDIKAQQPNQVWADC
jgi:hypothetical protein